MPEFIIHILTILRIIISLIGCAVIAISAMSHLLRFRQNVKTINSIRLNLGYTILLGLEFIIAADIINSVLSPNYYALGILAGLVLVRTILSYFLNKELQEIQQEINKNK